MEDGSCWSKPFSFFLPNILKHRTFAHMTVMGVMEYYVHLAMFS